MINKKIFVTFFFIIIIPVTFIFLYQNCGNFEVPAYSSEISLKNCNSTISIGIKYFCKSIINENFDTTGNAKWELDKNNTCSWANINPSNGIIGGIPQQIEKCDLVIKYNYNNLSTKTITKEINVIDIIKLSLDTNQPHNCFGQCLAIYQDTVLISKQNFVYPNDSNISEPSNYIHVVQEKELGLWEKKQILILPDELNVTKAQNDLLACNIEIYQDLAILGAPKAQNSQGAIYLYNKINDIWELSTKQIIPDDIYEFNFFGKGISINKEHIAIGSYGAGFVYIYKKNSSNDWQEVHKINLEDSDKSNFFAHDITLFEKNLFIGDYAQHTNNAVNYKGVIYILENQSSDYKQWEIKNKLFNNDNSKFLSKNNIHSYKNIAITSTESVTQYLDDSSDLNEGGAYIISPNDNNEWNLNKLILNDTVINKTIKAKLINETTALVSIYDFDYQDTISVGKVYIFKFIDNKWEQYTSIIPPEKKSNMLFGYSIASFENKILISAPYENVDGIQNKGAVYIYYY